MNTCIIKHRNGERTTVKTIAKARKGDWIVSTDYSENLFFSGRHTRDNVRCAYAKINRVPFGRVNSRRFKKVK